ncbi:Vacuolar import and degradation protein 24 [Schistosoma japonicum]|nr:Vacuolar import and degradation protein 24 [Schistosoma japonicum]
MLQWKRMFYTGYLFKSLLIYFQEKIPATSSLGNFHIDSFDYSILETSDTIFMRWKEKFIVPDPGLKHIEGASFAGFYYIGLQKSVGHVLGYYYHLNSEMFQSLELKYKPESTPSIFQLR